MVQRACRHEGEARTPVESRHGKTPHRSRNGTHLLQGTHRPGAGRRHPLVRHPRRGAWLLPHVSPKSARPCKVPREGTRHARQDLLQVRRQQHKRLPQAQLRHCAGLLRKEAGSEGRDHRDRSRAMGHRTQHGMPILRTRLQGLYGEMFLRTKALPPRGHTHLRRQHHPVSERHHASWTQDTGRVPRHDRFTRLRHLGGSGSGRHLGRLPL